MPRVATQSVSPLPSDGLEPIRGERVIDRIVAAAAELFAEKGFARATMDDLAERVGIAKPTLYVHGRTKAAILEQIFARLTAHAQQTVDEAAALPTTSERLYSLMRAWTHSAAALHSSYWQVWFSETNELEPEAAERIREATAKVVHDIRDIVVQGQERGEIDPGLDPTVATYSMLGTVLWTPKWFQAGGPIDLDVVIDMNFKIVSEGLFRRTPPGPASKRVPRKS
jgi:AcrR family transcriptional regulator